jgi:hypothetical protein
VSRNVRAVYIFSASQFLDGVLCDCFGLKDLLIVRQLCNRALSCCNHHLDPAVVTSIADQA